MAYRVEIAARAVQDIREAVAYIRQNSPQAADKWFRDLAQLQDSLKEMPMRFALIPEATGLARPYRSAPHYSHRVIYRIDEENSTVYVVRVYHGARQPLVQDGIESVDLDTHL